MHPFNFFSYQMSSLATEAIQGSAHRLRTVGNLVRHRNARPVHAKSFISNPTSFTRRWSNPDSSFPTMMNYRQRPLCFELKNVAVKNFFVSQWVYYVNRTAFQNHFWSDPSQVSEKAKAQTNYQLKKSLIATSENEQAVCCKKPQQTKGYSSPNKITFWSEYFTHPIIIAGDLP